MTLKAAFCTFMFCLICAGCGSSGSNNNDNGGNGGDGGNGDEAPFRNITARVSVVSPYEDVVDLVISTDEPIPYVTVPPHDGIINFIVTDFGDGADVSLHDHHKLRIDPDNATLVVSGSPFPTTGTALDVPYSRVSYHVFHTFTLADNGVVFVLSVTPDSGIVETTTEDNVASLRVYVVDPDGDG